MRTLKRLVGATALVAGGMSLVTPVVGPDATAIARQVFTTPQAAVERVRFEQMGGGVLHVLYDLVVTAGSSDAVFEVTLEVSQDGGKTYGLRPRSLTGDVGRGIRPGANKRVVWQSGRDVERLQIDRFLFRVTTQAGQALAEAPVVPTGGRNARGAGPVNPAPPTTAPSTVPTPPPAPTEIKLELFHAGSGIKAGWHLGTLTLAPGRVSWAESGAAGRDSDNFSITCREIQRAGRVRLVAQQRISIEARNYNFSNVVEGRNGKEPATGTVGVDAFEGALEKACPGYRR